MNNSLQILNQGWQLHQARRHAEAERLYRQVLHAEPDNANAWCYLGMVCHDQDRLEEAVAAYGRAIQIQPQFPIAFNNLGNTLRLLRRLDEAIRCFDHALKLKPDYVNAWKNKGTALVWEGFLDEALDSYRHALRLAPDDAETHKNLGVIGLLQGQFDTAWQEYEWRWRTSEIDLPKLPQPLWDGSPLDGRSILLTTEQGLGDTVQFIRYAAVLKRRYACRVSAWCPQALMPLLASCQAIDELVSQADPPPISDVYSPLLNLPGRFRETLTTIPGEVPYLDADSALVAAWRERLAIYRGRKIGLAWRGNPDNQADRMRSFSFAVLAPLGRWANLQFFSLQKGAGSEQLDEHLGLLDVIRFDDDFDGPAGAFMDSAAVLKNLDLLIACDTAIAHVAGALGVPVWLALSRVPDWRWLLDRDDSPWYPTIRLFRQPQVGDWASVFRKMADELPKLFPDLRPKEPAAYRLAANGFNRLVRARDGLLLYNHHDRYVGRSIDLYGEYSAGESELFRQFVKPGFVVVEGGANIGAHTLTLSQLVGDKGSVYAFEPQRIVFQTLCANMALNSRTNVHCRYEALGAQTGQAIVQPVDYRSENNFAGVAITGSGAGETVPVTTIDKLALPRCHLIKLDIEGAELDALRGAVETLARCRPLLYVENDRQESSVTLIEFLLSHGYRLYWHLPLLFNPRNYFQNPRNEFGEIISANVLGIPASITANIQGLRPIDSPDSDWRKL